MSGGSYDYMFGKIDDLAQRIAPTTILRKAFKTHLMKVAKACYAIEWVDSGDYPIGQEDDIIKECLGTSGPTLILSEAIGAAMRAKLELDTAIGIANKITNKENV